ncbi:protein RALF-like 1 [Macadamia integrifolia]|uniref:protein RALF-like 1 n=1 Tax=Macadamia integrifolia TaxID=60698 RepID=UPI001C528B0B|nr:protein RALF-like 1 [Macadamia integrifolia]
MRRTMAKSSGILVLVSIFIATFVLSTCRVDAGSDYHLGWIPTRSGCDGSIAECFSGNEFEMDTEINRRILATSNYISYAALKRNSVPCSKRGASYYNCKSGAQANPYSRGCSKITRCRGS